MGTLKVEPNASLHYDVAQAFEHLVALFGEVMGRCFILIEDLSSQILTHEVSSHHGGFLTLWNPKPK